MNRNDIARAALLEAGRPDLADLLPANRITLWWNWPKLGRCPTLDEVTLIARADDLARGRSGCGADVWHAAIALYWDSMPPRG